ncbi:hypothetical protein [Salmonirosea aquatica]|uniref:Uncharacterized protein n=1 Tax=Salmonirosea aquatica TaxID=2654236 RepID=A0A7C9FTF4_9BACT|nr:hypothetical protein [Cytophagaceae bacterium SJW1-29]
MLHKLYLPCLLLAAAALSGCEDHRLEPTLPLSVTTLATGLVAPIGVETAPIGRIFVSESGTGNIDSRILLIKPDGQKHPVVKGMNWAISAKASANRCERQQIVANPSGLATA